MRVVRHPDLANDIRDVAWHYADISERVLASFWLDPIRKAIRAG